MKNRCDVLNHDWKHLIRKGRATYICPKCGKDVMLVLVLLYDAGEDLSKLLKQ